MRFGQQNVKLVISMMVFMILLSQQVYGEFNVKPNLLRIETDKGETINCDVCKLEILNLDNKSMLIDMNFNFVDDLSYQWAYFNESGILSSRKTVWLSSQDKNLIIPFYIDVPKDVLPRQYEFSITVTSGNRKTIPIKIIVSENKYSFLFTPLYQFDGRASMFNVLLMPILYVGVIVFIFIYAFIIWLIRVGRGR